MKSPYFYSITPNILFGLIYRNTKVKWVFSFNTIVIFLHEENSNVYFQTIYSESLANRLLSLTLKFKNLKYINHGI